MPFVSGYLRLRKRRGRPDIGLPDPEGEVDPGYGIDEGAGIELPEVEPPDPPHGIWPPLTPENPWRPIDPGWGQGRPLPPTVGGGPARPPGAPPAGGVGGRPPERPHPIDPDAEVSPPIHYPPGMIWPPLPPGVHGKFLALVLIGGMGHGVKYRYVVIDADAKPPTVPGTPGHPLPPTPEPKG